MTRGGGSGAVASPASRLEGSWRPSSPLRRLQDRVDKPQQPPKREGYQEDDLRPLLDGRQPLVATARVLLNRLFAFERDGRLHRVIVTPRSRRC